MGWHRGESIGELSRVFVADRHPAGGSQHAQNGSAEAATEAEARLETIAGTSSVARTSARSGHEP
jgi:hypothetical protein